MASYRYERDIQPGDLKPRRENSIPGKNAGPTGGIIT